MKALFLFIAACAAAAQPCSYMGEDGMTDDRDCLRSRGTSLFVVHRLVPRLACSDGLAPVWSRGLGWMYADRTGRIVVKGVLAFDNGPDPFREGLVRFSFRGKCGYADRAGKVVIRPRYDGCLGFEQGQAKVCLGCKSECDGKDCEHRSLKGGDWLCLDPKGANVECRRKS